MSALIPQIIAGIKQFFLNGFRAFPLVIAVTAFILAFFQTNIAFTLLFVALAFVIPLATTGINVILEFILGLTKLDGSLYKVPTTAACTIVGPGGLTATPTAIFGLPTYWMASVVFFFSYIAINGISLYMRDADPAADAGRVTARKTQALVGAGLAIVVGLLFVVVRFMAANCETGIGFVTALITMAPLAFGWYKLASLCGADRLVDLFGIANGFLPLSAQSNQGYVCVPSTD